MFSPNEVSMYLCFEVCIIFVCGLCTSLSHSCPYIKLAAVSFLMSDTPVIIHAYILRMFIILYGNPCSVKIFHRDVYTKKKKNQQGITDNKSRQKTSKDRPSVHKCSYLLLKLPLSWSDWRHFVGLLVSPAICKVPLSGLVTFYLTFLHSVQICRLAALLTSFSRVQQWNSGEIHLFLAWSCETLERTSFSRVKQWSTGEIQTADHPHSEASLWRSHWLIFDIESFIFFFALISRWRTMEHDKR